MFVILNIFGLKSALSMSAADGSVVLMMRCCRLSEHAAITTEGFNYVVHVFGTNIVCNIYYTDGLYSCIPTLKFLSSQSRRRVETCHNLQETGSNLWLEFSS